MAQIQRTTVSGQEFFKPNAYITYRASDVLDKESGEIKKGWVFIITKVNPVDNKYSIKEEVKVLKFKSLINLEKVVWEFVHTDNVENVYTDVLSLRDKKNFSFIDKIKYSKDLKVFVSVSDWRVLEIIKPKVVKVLIWQLETWEIFSMDLSWNIQRSLMSKKFSFNNIFDYKWDYVQTPEEKAEQSQVVDLFFWGTNLVLTPKDKAVKAWRQGQFSMIYFLSLSWDKEKLDLDENADKAISLILKQLSWATTTTTTIPEDEISIEDIPF